MSITQQSKYTGAVDFLKAAKRLGLDVRRHGTQTVRANIGNIDVLLDTSPIQSAVNNAFSEPFKSEATAQEKTILFCITALRRAGVGL